MTDRPAASVRINKKQASQVLTPDIGASRAVAERNDLCRGDDYVRALDRFHQINRSAHDARCFGYGQRVRADYLDPACDAGRDARAGKRRELALYWGVQRVGRVRIGHNRGLVW